MAEDYKRKLINYFKKNLRKGYTPEALKWALIDQGYSRILVEASLNTATTEMARDAPVVKEKPKIIYSVFDENDQPVRLKKPWWKKILRQ